MAQGSGERVFTGPSQPFVHGANRTSVGGSSLFGVARAPWVAGPVRPTGPGTCLGALRAPFLSSLSLGRRRTPRLGEAEK